MADSEGRVALITGANGGIGKEVARQLALTGRYRTIHLACRDPAKARAALAELQAGTGKAVFASVALDVANLGSVVSALSTLGEPIDDLVMNAGGSGGRTPLAVTRTGVTDIFASNVLGHVALPEGLLRAGRLKRGSRRPRQPHGRGSEMPCLAPAPTQPGM